MTIISHSRKFIFLKTPKTAGTTIENYLSLYCDPEQGDIVFCAHPDSKPINCKLDDPFIDHMPIKRLRNYCDRRYPGEGIWENYYKFAVIRNPWDWFLSLFWWNSQAHKRNKEWVLKQDDRIMLARYYIHKFLPFRLQLSKDIWHFKQNDNSKEYLQMWRYVIDDEQYAADDQQMVPCLDYILRYETLTEDMSIVCKRLNIPWTGRFEANGKEIKENRHQRKDYRHYREVYTPKQAREIGKMFKKFNEVFGYQY